MPKILSDDKVIDSGNEQQNNNVESTKHDFSGIVNEVTDSKSEIDNLNTDEFQIKFQKNMLNRDEIYYELLKEYSNISKQRNSSRENKKDDFYRLIKSILGISLSVLFFFIIRMIFLPVDKIVALMPIIIGAFVTFIGSIIALPTIVANYLFNSNEDDNMTKIITHTQEFDTNNRNNTQNNTNQQKEW